MDMIHEGSDLKFAVKTDIAGFTLTDNDFSIVVKNRWGQVKYAIEKDEMFQDQEGNWYFTLENVRRGTYYAVLTAVSPDDDYDKSARRIVDRRQLCEVAAGFGRVGSRATVANGCQGHKDGVPVEYRQVWTVNLDDGEYLADKDGHLIYTGDGKRIQLKKGQAI